VNVSFHHRSGRGSSESVVEESATSTTIESDEGERVKKQRNS
jgi:hypothetical protein